MRLITIPLIILIILLLFAVFTPVLLLQATESIIPANILPADMRVKTAEVLADVSSILGRYDTCIDLYSYLISQNPESGYYYGKKAEYLQKTGKQEELVRVLDSAIARSPDNADYLLRKARITRALHKMSDSNASYERIDQLSPQNSVDFAYSGDAALDRSMYLQAFDRYSESLSVDPSDALTWEKRGDVIFALLTIPTAGLQADESLRSRDLYSEGITSYENAMRLNPSRYQEIKMKLDKRSDIYVPKSIAQLQSRYTQYRYLG